MNGRPGQESAPVEKLLALWVGLLSATLLALLAWPMLSGLVYGGDDLTLFHLPLRWFYWKALHDGQGFDWVPQLFCGFFLTGEGQAGTWHPLHYALYRTLSFESAYNLEVWLSYPWMYAGMVLFLRRSGAGGPAWSAALFGAMLFTFSASCLLHFIHMNGMAVVAHLPWLLLAIDVAAKTPRARLRLAAFAGVALLTASELLSGHPQYVWIVFVAELFWLAMATTSPAPAGSPARPAWKTLAGFAAAKAVGTLMGAVQLLPTLDHLLASQRYGAGLEVATYGSLPPLNIVQFLAPYLLAARVDGGNTHELGLYAGAVPIVLLVWLFSRRAALGADGRLVKAVAFFGAAAFLLALGTRGGLYYLQALLPVVGSFRIPARYLLLVHFAIAILAAAALARLVAPARQGERERGAAAQLESEHAGWPGAWKLAAFSAALALELRLVLVPERLGSPVGAAAGPLLFALAVGLVLLTLRHRLAGAALLVLVAAADVGFYGMSYAAWPGALDLDAVLEALPEAPSGSLRMATLQPDAAGVFTGNLAMMRGWNLSDGYAGLMPANRIDHRSLAGLRVAAVERVRRRGDTLPAEGLTVADDNWYAVPDPLPRHRLVARAVVSEDPARDFALLSEAELVTTVIVEESVPSMAGPAGEVLSLTLTNDTQEIGVRASGPQLLVIADRHHEGWTAEVDGAAARVLRVNGDFLGVPVAVGDSVVQLRFAPASLRYGKAVSAAGVGLGALLLAIGMWTSAGASAPSSSRRRSGAVE
ncbi:MAG: hypothetical protein ABR538_09930 [Candidatus Binatia bacterium]